MGSFWKIVLATVVIFSTGAVVGGLLVNHVHRGRIQARQERITGQPPQRPASWQPAPKEVLQRGTNEWRPMLEQQRTDFVLKAHRELQLNPEQREKIEKIVREGQERTREFWEKTQPELRKLVQETREKIRQELSPEQRAKFEELVRQQRPPGNAERPQPPRRMGGPDDQPVRPKRGQVPANSGESKLAEPGK